MSLLQQTPAVPSELDVPKSTSSEEDSDGYSSEGEPIEEDEGWEDAQSREDARKKPPPPTRGPKGLFMVSTTLKPSALLYDHLRF